jgi:hypothetical protein
VLSASGGLLGSVLNQHIHGLPDPIFGALRGELLDQLAHPSDALGDGVRVVLIG